MSKTKNKERSEIELLRGRIRKLESLCRQLRKRNKQLEKKTHFHENIIGDFADTITPKGETCPECGKGQITTVDLKFLLIKSCSLCEYRKKIKT